MTIKSEQLIMMIDEGIGNWLDTEHIILRCVKLRCKIISSDSENENLVMSFYFIKNFVFTPVSWLIVWIDLI